MIKIKINSRLKEAREAPGLDYGVFIHTAGKDFSLYLLDIEALREQIQKYKDLFNNDKKVDPDLFFSRFLKKNETETSTNPAVIGFIDAKDQNTDKHPCLKALDIAYTAIHEARSGQGIGKLMYQLAMANAAVKGKPLMPDRLHVEPAAAHIWNSFSNDPTVTKTFDKSGRPVSGRDSEHNDEVASYFDVEEPKKTKMKLDDCESTNEEPYGVPLNRAYYSDKFFPQLKSYIDNFKRFATENFTSMDGVESGLHSMSHAIFRRRFG